MKDVDSILEQLARIAVTIRRSGTRTRLQKADRSFNPKHHQDLYEHLVTSILARKPCSQSDVEKHQRLHGESLSIRPTRKLRSQDYLVALDELDSSDLTAVQARLIGNNLRRRNRFIYAQSHSKALDVPYSRSISHNLPQIIERPPQLTSEAPSDSQPRPELPPKTKAIPTQQAATTSIQTGTSASGVTDLPVSLQNPVPSQAASTQLSATVVKLKYPHPPKRAPDALVFRCPCCCQTLPAVFAEGTRWQYVA